MSGKGLDAIPLRIPTKWDPKWFERFVREVLSLADARNALEGVGVTISGNSTEPATIAASADISELLSAALITALTSSLPNARTLRVDTAAGLFLDDNGGGHTIEITILDNGLPIGKLGGISPYAVLGDDVGAGTISDIVAGGNDLLLARTADVLAFVQLTIGMVPDGLLTNVKLADMVQARIKGRAAGAGTGPPQDLTASQVKALLAYVAADIFYDHTTSGLAATDVQAAIDEIVAGGGGGGGGSGGGFPAQLGYAGGI